METHKIAYEIKCDCGRFLGTTDKSMEANIKCGNSSCRKLKQVKVVFLSEHVKTGHDTNEKCECGHCKGVKHE